MKNIFALILGFAFAAGALAQAKPAKPRFGSVYSNFTKDCKNFDGSNGSDGYSLCRGPGGYRIRVYYSAASSHYNVEEIRDKDGQGYPIAMLAIGFDDRKTRLEWRTVNGKPFAVIMRTPTYAEPKKENEYYGPVNGERLVVRGLKGVDLDAEVNAKEPSPNAKARELADAAYIKSKGN